MTIYLYSRRICKLAVGALCHSIELHDESESTNPIRQLTMQPSPVLNFIFL